MDMEKIGQDDISNIKVLVIGATGYIGKLIVEASLTEGHSTYALIRPETLISKYEFIQSLRNSGITILQASLDDHESLVVGFKQVDVVICAIRSMNRSDHLNIIKALKEARNIKRFIPSEFGCDYDRIEALEPTRSFFKEKILIRRAIEEACIPFTYIIGNCFNGFFLANFFQSSSVDFNPNDSPPLDKIKIYGSGDAKFICNNEEDIAIYTIKAINDIRTLNKKLHIRPPKNIITFNELVTLWEKKLGKTLNKEMVHEEKLMQLMEVYQFPENVHLGIIHAIVVKGEQCNFELGPNDVDATLVYPSVKYVSIDEYLDKFMPA